MAWQAENKADIRILTSCSDWHRMDCQPGIIVTTEKQSKHY